ncbi:MAG: RNA polymerase sigma factor [Acidobacteria bacterium]|nr:RNA polymerase sigma factor [Acidobacteriota bacterium]
MTANTCLDELRRNRKQKVVTFSDLGSDDESRIEEFFEQFTSQGILTEKDVSELFVLLEKLMGRLNDKDKMAFVLRELEGLSYADVAQAMKTTEVAVRIRISRSKKKLQNDLEDILLSGKRIND